MNKVFRQGIRHGIPIALGYLSVSFAFGMKAVGDGLTVLQAVLISMTNVTSAGQIAAVPLMVGGASLAEMALTQLTINLRYALMSLSLSRKLDGSMGTLQRMIFSFANTDEIFAVASSQPGKVGKYYLYGLMLTPWIGWSLGTFLGAAAGTLLPAFVRTALGIAIYGMFLAIILPPARKSRPVRFVVLVAVALSLCFHYIPGLNTVSPGFVIIICGVLAAALGAWRLAVTAGVTYLIRMLPLTVFRREIKSRFVRSFLAYIPYAVLGAMTFPDVFYSTGDMRTAIFGVAVAVLLAWRGRSLLTVAVAACCAVALAQGFLLLV